MDSLGNKTISFGLTCVKDDKKKGCRDNCAKSKHTMKRSKLAEKESKFNKKHSILIENFNIHVHKDDKERKKDCELEEESDHCSNRDHRSHESINCAKRGRSAKSEKCGKKINLTLYPKNKCNIRSSHDRYICKPGNRDQRSTDQCGSNRRSLKHGSRDCRSKESKRCKSGKIDKCHKKSVKYEKCDKHEKQDKTKNITLNLICYPRGQNEDSQTSLESEEELSRNRCKRIEEEDECAPRNKNKTREFRFTVQEPSDTDCDSDYHEDSSSNHDVERRCEEAIECIERLLCKDSNYDSGDNMW